MERETRPLCAIAEYIYDNLFDVFFFFFYCSVYPTIWTSAHVTQFSQPGWDYLPPHPGGVFHGGGSGLLPAGGSYTTMVPGAFGVGASAQTKSKSGSSGPQRKDSAVAVLEQMQKSSVRSGSKRRNTVATAGAMDFTIVIEKLEGDCLRCRLSALGGNTTQEIVRFKLLGTLLSKAEALQLACWSSNSSHHFVRGADILVSKSGEFDVTVPRDTIVTVTSTTGQNKGTEIETCFCQQRSYLLCFFTALPNGHRRGATCCPNPWVHSVSLPVQHLLR